MGDLNSEFSSSIDIIPIQTLKKVGESNHFVFFHVGDSLLPAMARLFRIADETLNLLNDEKEFI